MDKVAKMWQEFYKGYRIPKDRWVHATHFALHAFMDGGKMGDPPVYIIRKRGTKPIKNRQRLRQAYLHTLWVLLWQFKNNTVQTQMDVHYLNLYAYRFLKYPDGDILVIKARKSGRCNLPMPWAYITTKDPNGLFFLEGTMDFYEMKLPYIDLFMDLVNLWAFLDRKLCVYCLAFITCPDDVQALRELDEGADEVREELRLKSAQILPLCTACAERVQQGTLSVDEVVRVAFHRRKVQRINRQPDSSYAGTEKLYLKRAERPHLPWRLAPTPRKFRKKKS